MENISEEQFWEIADNWYKRTLKLAAIWQLDNGFSKTKKAKAVYLWSIMAVRMAKIQEKAIEINTPRKPAGLPLFPPGGIIHKPVQK